jgi:nitronate monooxygenase
MLDPAAMQRELAAMRAGTAGPYAVNFFSHAPPTPDAERERRWRELLAPYYVELGLDPGQVVASPTRCRSGRRPPTYSTSSSPEW